MVDNHSNFLTIQTLARMRVYQCDFKPLEGFFMPKPLTKADIISITYSENSSSRKKSLNAYSNAVTMLLYSASGIFRSRTKNREEDKIQILLIKIIRRRSARPTQNSKTFLDALPKRSQFQSASELPVFYGSYPGK